MKDWCVCFCCKYNNIGLNHTIFKGQLNDSISKSMATKRTSINNDERTCILDGVDLVGLADLGEQIPLFDP